MSFLKSLISNKKYFILFLIGVFAVLYFVFLSPKTATTNNASTNYNITVKRGIIESNLKVVGSAKLTDEQKLRFNQIGTVTHVYARAGDKVTKNQLIAELDKNDVNNDIQQSEQSLKNAQINLQQLLNGSTEAQSLTAKNAVADTQKKIEVAQKNITIAKQNEVATIAKLEKDLQLAQTDVTNKQNTLVSAQKDLSDNQVLGTTDVSNATNSYAASVSDAILKAKDALIEADNMITDLNTVLGKDYAAGTWGNNAYQSSVGVLDSTALSRAHSSFDDGRNKQQTANDALNTVQSASSPKNQDIIDLLTTVQNAMTTLVQAADDTYTVLQKSIVTPSLSQSSLDGLKSSISGTRSSGQSKISSVKSAITTLQNLEAVSLTQLRTDNGLLKKQDAIKSAEYSLEQAQSTLKNLQDTFAAKKADASLTRISAENNLVSLENTLKAQQATLNDVLRGATTEAIALARNDVSSRTLAVNKVRQNIDKYELRAPFDGVISSIDFKTGDNLVADESKFVYFQNPNLVEITVPLDQIDVMKAKEGLKANIVFDALPNKSFDGVIGQIDPTPQIQSGVVSYNAILTLNKGESRVFSGMTSTVNILLERKENALSVPTLALSTRRGKSFVKKLVDGVATETEVITGISSGKDTEILSGLSEGDEVVVLEFQKAAANAAGNSSANPAQQFFRATGGGGGNRSSGTATGR